MEEPKKYWYIDCDGEVMSPSDALCTTTQEDMERIGNSFDTKEEAEKVVKKLQAYKRLKDKGFKFTKQISKYDKEKDMWHFLISASCKEWDENIEADLDLLFGGKR